MTLIYVIGPSGVGKGTLISPLRDRHSKLCFVDLDKAVKDKAGYNSVRRVLDDYKQDGFWRLCERVFCELSQESARDAVPRIIDVGAGALEADVGRQYFIQHGAQVICVYAPAEQVYRRKERDISFPTFQDREYGPKRQKVYKAAARTINNPDSAKINATAELEQAILELIASAKTEK